MFPPPPPRATVRPLTCCCPSLHLSFSSCWFQDALRSSPTVSAPVRRVLAGSPRTRPEVALRQGKERNVRRASQRARALCAAPLGRSGDATALPPRHVLRLPIMPLGHVPPGPQPTSQVSLGFVYSSLKRRQNYAFTPGHRLAYASNQYRACSPVRLVPTR